MHSSPYIRTQISLTRLLNGTELSHVVDDVDGLHVVEEFGNLAE